MGWVIVVFVYGVLFYLVFIFFNLWVEVNFEMVGIILFVFLVFMFVFVSVKLKGKNIKINVNQLNESFNLLKIEVFLYEFVEVYGYFWLVMNKLKYYLYLKDGKLFENYYN